MKLIYVLLLNCFLRAESDVPEERDGCYKNKIEVLSQVIDSTVLHLALKGYSNIQDSIPDNEKFLAIIDFSRSSTEKRFYLISMKDTVLTHTDYVSHGKYSGDLYAHSFSNEIQSLKTSLGFYKVAESYLGCHGLSIRLDGLDPGYNDNARTRAIVIHAAKYADPVIIKELGRLGRSFGCPALPFDGFSYVVNHIKGNAILFNYYPDESYLRNSIWLH